VFFFIFYVFGSCFSTQAVIFVSVFFVPELRACMNHKSSPFLVTSRRWPSQTLTPAARWVIGCHLLCRLSHTSLACWAFVSTYGVPRWVLFCFAESETKSSHTRRLCGLTTHKACTDSNKAYNMEFRNMPQCDSLRVSWGLTVMWYLTLQTRR